MGTTIYNVLFKQVITDEGDTEYTSNLKSFSTLSKSRDYAKEIVESAFRAILEGYGYEPEDIKEIESESEFEHFTGHSYNYDFEDKEGYYVHASEDTIDETDILLEAVILPTEVED